VTEDTREAEAGAGLLAEEEARAELRAMVEDLDGIRARLVALHRRLPLPPAEAAWLDDEVEMEFPADIRSAIECILTDCLQPAIRDLAEAATYQPKKGSG